MRHLLNAVCLSGSSQEQAFPEIVTNSGKAALSSRLVTLSFLPVKHLEHTENYDRLHRLRDH